jgi:mono/diheme cytochrome c family protein
MMLGLGCAGLVALFALGQTTTRTTTPEQQAAEERAAVPLVIPASEKERKNPLPATPEEIERGTQLYASQCVMCHGPRGAGDGELGRKYGFALPDFRDPAVQARRTDGELFYVLTQGHGSMPAQGKRLSDEYRWSMVLAIRSMARESGP